MPGIGSAAKRHRQSEDRRMRNRIFRTKVKTVTKKLSSTITSNAKEEAEVNYKALTSLLDKAVSKKIFHKNTAARKKAKMYALLRKMS